jgi:N-terminal acetyltransferase B complex catalytic subunit
MTSVTPFIATDLLHLTNVNLDTLTENYHAAFYLQYLTQWPSMFFKGENPNGEITGYMMGKSEGRGKEWHSHITAVTVAYDYRRLGLAGILVDHLRQASEAPDQDCYFMDLYVRASNKLAIDMYKKFGFHVFRRVERYYGSGDNPNDAEDAFDMRWPMKRDENNESLKKSAWTEESPYYRYRYEKLY